MSKEETTVLKQVKVGIADYKIEQAPNSLITIGLGSCVGIALYDPRKKTGGLVHIMLPESKLFKDTSKWVKYADLAIPRVASEIAGTKTSSLIAKMAGGASMFQFNTQNKGLQIGDRNIQAVKEVLNELEIPIIGEHVGGTAGRTMKVDLDTFDVSIRMVNRDMYYI